MDLLSCPNSVPVLCENNGLVELSQFCVGTLDLLSCPNSVSEQWIYWVVPILCWNNVFIELSQFCPNSVLERWIYWAVPILSQFCVGTMDVLSCPNSVLEQWIVSICSNFVLEQWIYWVVPILCWNNGLVATNRRIVSIARGVQSVKGLYNRVATASSIPKTYISHKVQSKSVVLGGEYSLAIFVILPM